MILSGKRLNLLKTIEVMLPINVNDLLEKNRVESNRIEFKEGWNPVRIYQSICAFANDIDNLGGGYILVGVKEEKGKAVRPVCGLTEEELEDIQKKMIGFNNLIDPYYRPRTSVEPVDGKNILVIWIPMGEDRPYAVPEDITVKKNKKYQYYIRSNSSSIEAKGSDLDDLRDLAKKVPFDDRGNSEISIADISPTLVWEHLSKAGSRLTKEFNPSALQDTLEKMNLLTGPTERRLVKNVAAMMFCEQPDKFFPRTQVDIVIFPEGRIGNPNNLIEAPAIKGPVPSMIKSALEYLRTNVIKERIIKPKDREESVRYFNYPYQALEEAVVNALYHRDYTEREPVEITIEPNRISILSYSGPDRSIPMDSIKAAESLRSRRYRNVRLGDFLKELDLSEGRATGIPTIQEELKKNGSGKAVIETDDDRSYFLIDIPCHEGFEPVLEYTREQTEDIHVIVKHLSSLLSQVLSQVFVADNQSNSNDLSQVLSQVCLKSVMEWRERDNMTLIAKVLLLTRQPISMKSLLVEMDQTNRGRFMANYIKPMIELGLLEMTVPDQPNSSKQKYVIGSKGKELLWV